MLHAVDKTKKRQRKVSRYLKDENVYGDQWKKIQIRNHKMSILWMAQWNDRMFYDVVILKIKLGSSCGRILDKG